MRFLIAGIALPVLLYQDWYPSGAWGILLAVLVSLWALLLDAITLPLPTAAAQRPRKIDI